ncbi:MAG: hypothetical protein J6330_03060, partial [Clostridia bacterium]|nr:hypothetical protein [Clostridia bacterium]
MEFPSANGIKRPVRCSDGTRRFAYESLGHKYGLQCRETPCVKIDCEFDDPLKKHDVAIRAICEQAPVRICEDELISGSATLGNAIKHVIPADHNGSPVFMSMSHL